MSNVYFIPLTEYDEINLSLHGISLHLKHDTSHETLNRRFIIKLPSPAMLKMHRLNR